MALHIAIALRYFNESGTKQNREDDILPYATKYLCECRGQKNVWTIHQSPGGAGVSAYPMGEN